MITTHQLSLRAGARTLVQALDWQVRPGECWCIVGRNGAGKSTLLRALAGMRTPEAGEVTVGGRRLADWPLRELARERAWLPQGHSDAFGYRVIDTVLAARHPWQDARYWESESDVAAARTALDALDVADLAERDIRSLSGGERQRVAIAGVLAQETPLLLLDEPTNALDLAHQVGVMRLLGELCRTRGKTVVFVSHDLNLAGGTATHALLLNGDGTWQAGDLAATFTPAALTACLGYPIEAVRHGLRTLYLPANGVSHA
jgi:iron complex transport system ATP-binding protein